ncbi:hypothetical protein AGLY_005022 [Aphis glycines]|uniref:Uncharacterized protein n=1 Tax=Aphis glycines TaxID=307491 RepID=A0A6G0TW12_APHGL|nr:hypothetical protein AGLY_005022 [Aphis glycines]
MRERSLKQKYALNMDFEVNITLFVQNLTDEVNVQKRTQAFGTGPSGATPNKGEIVASNKTGACCDELNDEGVVDTQFTTLSELFTFPWAVDTFVWYDDGEVGIDVTTDLQNYQQLRHSRHTGCRDDFTTAAIVGPLLFTVVLALIEGFAFTGVGLICVQTLVVSSFFLRTGAATIEAEVAVVTTVDTAEIIGIDSLIVAIVVIDTGDAGQEPLRLAVWLVVSNFRIWNLCRSTLALSSSSFSCLSLSNLFFFPTISISFRFILFFLITICSIMNFLPNVFKCLNTFEAAITKETFQIRIST